MMKYLINNLINKLHKQKHGRNVFAVKKASHQHIGNR